MGRYEKWPVPIVEAPPSSCKTGMVCWEECCVDLLRDRSGTENSHSLGQIQRLCLLETISWGVQWWVARSFVPWGSRLSQWGFLHYPWSGLSSRCRVLWFIFASTMCCHEQCLSLSLLWAAAEPFLSSSSRGDLDGGKRRRWSKQSTPESSLLKFLYWDI